MRVRLLLGFNCNEKVTETIITYLKQQGVDIEEYSVELLKEGVFNAIENDDYNVILYKYGLEERAPLSIDDCDYIITKKEDVLFIPILPNNLKGTKFVQGLLNLGINFALFEDDASMDNVAQMMLNPRSRKDAKIYYGLTLLSREISGNDRVVSIQKMFDYLCSKDNGSDISKKVEYVKNNVSTEEFERILKRLPDNIKAEVIATGKYDLYFSKQDFEKADNADIKDVKALKRVVESGITIEIGVGGVETGVGTTHTCMALAHNLASKGYKVALVEQNESGAFSDIYSMFISKNVGLKKQAPIFTYENIDFYPYCKYSQFASKYKKKYNFVIIDFGSNYYCSNYFCIAKKILVGSAAEWKAASLVRHLKDAKYDEDILDLELIYIVSFAREADIAAIKKKAGYYNVNINAVGIYNWKEENIVINNILNGIGAVGNVKSAKKGIMASVFKK